MNKNDPSNVGVVKKMIGQVEGLKNCGWSVDYLINGNDCIFLNNEKIFQDGINTTSWINKWKWFDHLSRLDYVDYDCILVRYGMSTPSFVKWLRRIKLENPQISIVIDMPTYPYRKEWVGLKGLLINFIDGRFNKHLKKYADLVLHSGTERSIFGIRTLLITNGIRKHGIPLRQLVTHHGIQLIALGKWQYWHGLDRLIQGLDHFTKKGGLDVRLVIVGEGPDKSRLVKLVKLLGLEDIIEFKPTLVGEGLNELMNFSDMAIGTLGLHRKSVQTDSSLKHREYVARGIPFLFCGGDSDIPDTESFVCLAPSDDTPIDIWSIKTFIEKYNSEEGKKRMVSLMENKLSWDIKMKMLSSHLRNMR